MLRSLKIGSVLAATTAAAALAFAAPASASANAGVAGIAYALPNFTGPSSVMLDDQIDCTPIVARSAQNTSPTTATTNSTITFYSTYNAVTQTCSGQTYSLAPGDSEDDLGFTAAAYVSN